MDKRDRAALRRDADAIIKNALEAAQPDTAVKKALRETGFGSRTVHLVAIGKAAWQMAKCACEECAVADGFVITKYGHSKGPIENVRIFEAGHPVPDENTFSATGEVIREAEKWGENDAVLFLISGGGSALFEKPLISGEEMQAVTSGLLACGADIVEINTVRKRLSAVKGGKFAQICAPARVYAVILSDVLGDPPDAIASGPACPDATTCEDALGIIEKYSLDISPAARALLGQETPKSLANVETRITGSVKQLCISAENTARRLGYEPVVLTDTLSCEAREAGRFLAAIAAAHQADGKSLAYICGGETVVRLTGSGLGGRNQELALAAAEGLSGLENTAVFSLGSDGTDGPTDAAGGYTDEFTAPALKAEGVKISEVLADNDSYHALEKTGGLLFTGPTGTNVNDLAVLLIKRS